MKFPNWAPSALFPAVEHYAEEGRKGGENAPQCALLAEMWQRLLTRPEMESIWPWIIEVTDGIELYGRMGFFREFGMSIERFHVLPKLSEAAYATEMEEIAKMAVALSDRLKQFESCVPGGNPFAALHMPLRKWDELSLLMKDNLEMLPKMMRQFPSMTEMLDLLTLEARKEAELQIDRLPVSRKSKELKPFLIREVLAYFRSFENGYSPSKIATICSVALEDASIDGGLIGKYAKQADAMVDLE